MTNKLEMPLDPFPEVVGYWKMPGGDGVWSVKFSAYKRPRWLTIKMMWLVFEWKWEDKRWTTNK